MLQKFVILFSAFVLLFSSVLTFGQTSYASESIGNDEFIEGEEFIEAGEIISSYFDLDENGELIFTADQETLVNELGVSEEDAALMISASKDLSKDLSEAKNQEAELGNEMGTFGFVGIRINLGPKVRAMNGWAAGAFAAGYVGWYAKTFAVNPVTAGVAALITAGTGVAVKNAVENKLRFVEIGAIIPKMSKKFHVNVP